MSGLTDTGMEIPTIDDIVAAVSAAARAAIDPALDTGPTSVVGQLIGIQAERERSVWLAVRDVWQAFAPSGASGQSLTQLALLTGTVRRSATKSQVTATVNLNAGVTLPAGSRARVGVDVDAIFETVADVTNPGGSPANVSVVMTAVTAGATRANSGTLNTIVTPVSGWNSVTNALDADVGFADENDTALRARREAELRVQGSGNLDAIVADVDALDGVLDARGTENDTDFAADGLDPHVFRIVVWDGNPPEAVDDQIAQAIWDSKPVGIPSVGVEFGTAIDANGDPRVVNFARATELPVYLDLDIETDPETFPADGSDQIKAALVDYADAHWSIGEDVILSALYGPVFSVSGVRRVGAIRAGLAPAPVGTSDLSTDADEIARADTSRIVLVIT